MNCFGLASESLLLQLCDPWTWFPAHNPALSGVCVCAENVATALRDANTHVQFISPDRTRQKL